MPTIQTVLGPRPSESFEHVLAHEHVFIDLYRVYQPHRDLRLWDEELAIEELSHFKKVGGQLLVDLTTSDLGRDAQKLRRVAERTGVNIVMGTGRYRSPFYESTLNRVRTVDLASEFIHDIEVGIGGIRAGVVGEIGTDLDYVSAVEERVHRAAAEAAMTTGLGLVTHSLGSDVGLAQLELFEGEGLSPGKIAIGHADTYGDRSYHRDITQSGAWLVFDTVRGQNPHDTRGVIRMIEWAIEDDYADRVMISHDVCSTAHYRSYGGNGYAFVHGSFRTVLDESRIPMNVIGGLLGRNAARFLEV